MLAKSIRQNCLPFFYGFFLKSSDCFIVAIEQKHFHQHVVKNYFFIFEICAANIDYTILFCSFKERLRFIVLQVSYSLKKLYNNKWIKLFSNTFHCFHLITNAFLVLFLLSSSSSVLSYSPFSSSGGSRPRLTPGQMSVRK